MASKPYNVAVVGYGMSAKVFHIPLVQALPSDFKLYGIVQRSPKPDDDASKDHPDVKHWRSVDDLYSDPDVDVVVVTSIPETHFAMCKAALEAGKHVVVEKPFAPTVKEADELLEIAKKSGKLLTVYQNRRWDSDYLTLRQIIDQGALGEIVEFENRYDRHRPDLPPNTWKVKEAPGHGSIFDLGTHIIDQVYHCFGLPQKVTGFITTQRRGIQQQDGLAHDSHTVLLQYPNALLVTVKAAIISPEQQQLHYWVRGTKGSFKKFGVDVQEDQLKAGLRPGDEGFGVEPESQYATLTESVDGKTKVAVYPTVKPATYLEFYHLFAKALKGEGEVPVKPEDARDCLRIIEAAFVSSREGRTVEL